MEITRPPAVRLPRRPGTRALKMACPHCGESGSRVVRSRGAIVKDEVHRRRQCSFCSDRFPTGEQVDWLAFAKEQNLPVPPTWDDLEAAFHRAWGEAKELTYNKPNWLAFQEIVTALKRTDPGAPHHR